MGKVINIAIFAFILALSASCRSLHTNYQSQENVATQAKFSTSGIIYGNLTELLGNRVAWNDSTLRNTKIKITLYDTIRHQGECKTFPRAEIQVEEQEKEGRSFASQDTQVVLAADTTILQSSSSVQQRKETSNKKVKINLDFVLFLLLIIVAIKVVQIVRKQK